MKEYLLIHKDEVEFSIDYKECKNPSHNKWTNTDIFEPGEYQTKQDFDVSCWLIFDNDTGELWDMAAKEEVAIEAIEDYYNGKVVKYDKSMCDTAIDDYKRAMSIF